MGDHKHRRKKRWLLGWMPIFGGEKLLTGRFDARIIGRGFDPSSVGPFHVATIRREIL